MMDASDAVSLDVLAVACCDESSDGTGDRGWHRRCHAGKQHAWYSLDDRRESPLSEDSDTASREPSEECGVVVSAGRRLLRNNAGSVLFCLVRAIAAALSSSFPHTPTSKQPAVLSLAHPTKECLSC